MTAPKFELTANLSTSTLNGAINASVTSLILTSASTFPADGNFRILLGSEIMLATAVATNTLTVVRGYESTTAASHSNGVAVNGIVTAGSLETIARQNWPGLWGTQRPLGRLTADNGTTILTLSDFTWVNKGNATASDLGGGILLRAPGNDGHNGVPSLKILTRSHSAPKAYIGAFSVCHPTSNSNDESQHYGLGFRENSTGKITLIMMVNQAHGNFSAPKDGTNRIQVRNWAGPTSLTFATIRTETANAELCKPVGWIKIEDDNTNLKFYVGLDSEEWVLIHTVGRTSYLASGPDEVFWYGQNSGYETDCLTKLVHWSTV